MKTKHIIEGGITYEVRFFANGNKKWLLNGLNHRENGPAFERKDKRNEWWLRGRRHNENGPAVERAGYGQKRWFLGYVEFRKENHALKVLEISNFYETCSVGDILNERFILLKKISCLAGKLFNVYDIKHKKIYDKLVYLFVK